MKFALGLWMAFSSLSLAGGLDFPETSKVVHAPADAKTVSIEFSFSNKTAKPVTIEKADGGCSCMSIQIVGEKMNYAPGESGVVRANFDMGNFSGEVDKGIMIWLKEDAPENPSIQLKIHVEIPLVVKVEPKTLKWEVGEQPESRTFQITMEEKKPIKILSVAASNPLFAYELKTLEEGKRYEIKVTPSATTAPALAIFHIKTDCGIEKHRDVQAFASIRKASVGEKATAR